MSASTALRRASLREAERALRDPAASTTHMSGGTRVGAPQRLTPEQLDSILAAEEAAARPSIGVTVYFADTPVPDRALIEDPLADYVEAAGVGVWVGAGQGSVGDRSFFTLRFAVQDVARALPIFQRKLRELGAGPSTTLGTSDGLTYAL